MSDEKTKTLAVAVFITSAIMIMIAIGLILSYKNGVGSINHHNKVVANGPFEAAFANNSLMVMAGPVPGILPSGGGLVVGTVILSNLGFAGIVWGIILLLRYRKSRRR